MSKSEEDNTEEKKEKEKKEEEGKRRLRELKEKSRNKLRKFPEVLKRRPVLPKRREVEKVAAQARKRSEAKLRQLRIQEREGQKPDERLAQVNNSKNDKRTDKQKADDQDKERKRLGAEYTEKFTGEQSGIASTTRGATSRGTKDLGFTAGLRMMQQGPERPHERTAAKRGLKEWQQMQRDAIRGGRANKPLEDPRDRERQQRAEQRKEAKRRQEQEERRKRRRRGKGYAAREYSDSASLPRRDREFENGFFDNATKENKAGKKEPNDRSKSGGIENSKFLTMMRERKGKTKENTGKTQTKQPEQAKEPKQQKQSVAKQSFIAQQSRDAHQRSRRDEDIDSRTR